MKRSQHGRKQLVPEVSRMKRALSMQQYSRRRAPSVKQMKASGMTDEEIAEIVDMESEMSLREQGREREIQEITQILNLESKAERGELDDEGVAKLRSLRGVVYSFKFNGQQILVNHCLIAKIIMAAIILFCVASIFYISAFHD